MKIKIDNVFKITATIFCVVGIVYMVVSLMCNLGMSIDTDFFGILVSQFVVLIVAMVGFWQNKRQTAKEFVANSRSRWLNTTRDLFSEFAAEIFKLDSIKSESEMEIILTKINELNVKLILSFNPDDQMTTKLNDLSEKLGSLDDSLSVNRENKSALPSNTINININRIHSHLKVIGSDMQEYFKDEWEKVKSNIS